MKVNFLHGSRNITLSQEEKTKGSVAEWKWKTGNIKMDKEKAVAVKKKIDEEKAVVKIQQEGSFQKIDQERATVKAQIEASKKKVDAEQNIKIAYIISQRKDSTKLLPEKGEDISMKVVETLISNYIEIPSKEDNLDSILIVSVVVIDY